MTFAESTVVLVCLRRSGSPRRNDDRNEVTLDWIAGRGKHTTTDAHSAWRIGLRHPASGVSCENFPGVNDCVSRVWDHRWRFGVEHENVCPKDYDYQSGRYWIASCSWLKLRKRASNQNERKSMSIECHRIWTTWSWPWMWVIKKSNLFISRRR